MEDLQKKYYFNSALEELDESIAYLEKANKKTSLEFKKERIKARLKREKKAESLDYATNKCMQYRNDVLLSYKKARLLVNEFKNNDDLTNMNLMEDYIEYCNSCFFNTKILTTQIFDRVNNKVLVFSLVDYDKNLERLQEDSKESIEFVNSRFEKQKELKK